MSRMSFTTGKPDKKAVLFFLIAAASLLLWLIPALLGRPMGFELFASLAWVVVVGLMLVLLVKLADKKRALLHTAYLDEDMQCGFAPNIGIFPCESQDEFINTLILAYANNPALMEKPSKGNVPDNFRPTLILETSAFLFRRDAGIKSTAPVGAVDDITVDEWRGRIIDTRNGAHTPFNSFFELEEARR